MIHRFSFRTQLVATGIAMFVTLVAISSLPATSYAASCIAHTATIQSDGTNTVVGDTVDDTIAVHPAWTASIPGATWIWKTGATANNETVAFEKSFTVVGTVLSATLDVASDNSYKVFIDGVEVAADPALNNFQVATQDTHNLTAFVTPGTHTLRIEVTNAGVYDETSNPAGLLYKFVVESEECPPPPCNCGCGSSSTNVSGVNGINIGISQSGCINNTTSANASTGNNSAGGSKGGRGGRGGSVKANATGGGNSIGNNGGATGGAGGNGGAGAEGGLVQTGAANATASTTNIMNRVRIRINL